MGTEQRNAASEATERFLSVWGDRDRVLHEATSWFAADFERQDRRRLVSVPEAGAEEYIKQHLVFFDLGDEVPTFEIVKILAVRGERLVSVLGRIRYDSALAIELIWVGQWDERLEQLQKIVVLDADDTDGAVAVLGELELDMLNAEGDR